MCTKSGFRPNSSSASAAAAPQPRFSGIATASFTRRTAFGNLYRTILPFGDGTGGALLVYETYLFRNPSRRPNAETNKLRQRIAAATNLPDFGDIGTGIRPPNQAA